MEHVILVIHLMLALALIGLVMIQRSEGGGLGIGGGGGLGQFASVRSTANVLTRATAICAGCFFLTSLSLGYIASSKASTEGLLDKYAQSLPAQEKEQPAADGADKAAGTDTVKDTGKSAKKDDSGSGTTVAPKPPSAPISK